MKQAIDRYIFKNKGKTFLYWYNSDAITSLATSKEAVIITTATTAPANNLLRPLTE
jgi:hypothetical protein